MISRDLAPVHLKTDQSASSAFLLLFQQSVVADEFTFVELHDPTQSGFEQRRGSVHVVTIEEEFRFEPQCIPRSQSGRKQAERAARFEYPIPDEFGFFSGKVQLETIFTSVTGARHNCIRAQDLGGNEMVVRNPSEMGVG